MQINLMQLLLDKIEHDGDAKKSADDLGVSPSSIGHWKRGQSEPGLMVLQKVLDLYFTKHTPCDMDVGMGKVLLLMPVYRAVEGRTFATITRALMHYGRDQIETMFQFSTDVERARCLLADRALATDSQWFIFADADAVLPCGYGPYLRGMGYDIPDPNAGLNAFARILSAPEDQKIVSALCFLRRHPLVPATASGVRGGSSSQELIRRYKVAGETGTEEEDWVGMHFTRIHRSVFEAMRASLPELAPKSEREPWGYFLKDSAEMGEDVSFGLRAKKLDIKSYVDTTLRVGHVVDSVI